MRMDKNGVAYGEKMEEIGPLAKRIHTRGSGRFVMKI